MSISLAMLLLAEHQHPLPVAGNNVMDKLQFETGRMCIDDTQYFQNVPETAWNFYISGYQPAQKWL